MLNMREQAEKLAREILDTPCPMCGSKHLMFDYDYKSFDTEVRCWICGFMVARPEPINGGAPQELAFMKRVKCMLDRLDGLVDDMNAISMEETQNHEKLIEEMFEDNSLAEYMSSEFNSGDNSPVKWIKELNDEALSSRFKNV